MRPHGTPHPSRCRPVLARPLSGMAASAVAAIFAATAMFAAAPVFAADPAALHLSVIRGPSGLSAAWLMASPPRTAEIRLDFLTVASADLALAKLLSGETDAAVLPVNVAAKLYNATGRIRAAAVVGGGMVRFLSADQSLSDLSGLKGQEVAIGGQKATPDYLFRLLMEARGLAPGSGWTPNYSLAFPEIVASLASGRIRHAVLPEPFATQALMANPALRAPADLGALWKAQTGLSDYPMSLLVVSAPLADTRRAALAAFLRAYRASVERCIAEPEATAALAERLELGMKAQVAAKAIPRSRYRWESALSARPEIERMLLVFLGYEAASVGGRLPDEAFYLQAEPGAP